MNFSNQSREPGRQLTGFIAVVIIHVALIYALLNGLGKHVITFIKEIPIEVSIIEEVKPPPPPPPPEIKPQIKVTQLPKPFIPPPEVAVQTPPSPQAITAVSTETPTHQDFHPQVAAPTDKSADGPVVVKPQVDFSTCEKPAYPRNARANGDSGTVRIKFLIEIDGRVAETNIERSSSHRELDNAAVNALTLCRFKPGTVDGKPQKSWTSVDYVWKLPN